LIYLSADSEEILNEIDDDATLVIGGVVDRNRHKGAALDIAKKYGFKTAKLPLSDHVKLKSSQVLTVVHVFEILTKFRETNSWAEAIEKTIPRRKIVLKKP